MTLLGIAAYVTWAPSVPAWLRGWLPLLTLPFLYGEMPALIAAAGTTTPFDSTVIGWESAMFGEQPARTWAVRWPSRSLSELLHAAYLSYYAIIFSVPAALWLTRRREEFVNAMFVLTLTFVVCFAIYVVFPVAGPRYLWQPPRDISGPVRAATLAVLETGSSRGTAFPSSHVAVATTQSLLALRYFGWKAGPLPVVAAGLAAGAVYGGFHYLIDVIAGALLGGLVFLVGLFGITRRKRYPTEPSEAVVPR